MYRMKKIYDVPDNMKLPDSMYRVKPMNANINLESAESQSELMNGNADKSRSSVLRESNKHESKRKSESDLQLENKNNRQSKRKRSKSPVKKDSLLSPMDTAEDNIGQGPTNKEEEKLMKDLEKKQKDIIARLLKLRAVLDGQKSDTTKNTTSISQSAAGGATVSAFVDVVIHADMENPPLSVLLLSKKLREAYGNAAVDCKSHVHSSCGKELCGAAKSFTESFVSGDILGSSEEQITITVIWKKRETSEPELIVEPQHPAITGEANMARYLSRLLPLENPLNYDTLPWDDIIRIDGLLEKSSDQPKVISVVEEHLKSTKSCIFGELTLADAVLYSSIECYLTKNKGAGSKFPSVKGWLDRCRSLV